MDASTETCGSCRLTWSLAFGANNCPMCELTDKVDEHTESILLQILTSHYSKYIFEIDDKTAAWNKERGFSFRINRKHNLMYLRILENINLKNTYLLMASHIESAFNDIQHAYRLTYGKNPDGVNCKTTLHSLFVDSAKNNNFNDTIFKNVKYKKTINHLRLVTNIIKHKNSIVKPSYELGKLLRLKESISLDEMWGMRLPAFNRQWSFGEVCEIICIVRAFLFSLSVKLISKSKIVQPCNINMINTLSLLKLQLRRNISKEILKDIQNEGIMIFIPSFFRKANDTKLFNFLKERIKILEKLNKINAKYVLALETGIGFIPDDDKYITFAVSKINALVLNMHGNQTKAKLNNKVFRKLYLKILDNLSIRYGRNMVSSLVWNELHDIKRKILPELIIDFYKEIFSLGKKDAGILMRGFGGIPFKKWNPFNFNI